MNEESSEENIVNHNVPLGVTNPEFKGQPKAGLIPLNRRSKEERRAIQSKGGKSFTDKKYVSAFENVTGKNLSIEQKHFITLLRGNQYASLIRDMIVVIVREAKTAEDWHKVLTQVMKMPFIEQVYNDMYKTKQKDVIPIIIDLLRKHGQDQIIAELNRELKRNGYFAETPTTIIDITAVEEESTNEQLVS